MIVVCTSCQAKFRISDEKVGAKGAKVRCSKCKTVFIVKREAPTPAPEAVPDSDPFAAAAARPSGADHFGAPDPFAQGSGDPFAAAAAAGEGSASRLPLTDLSDLAGARGEPGGGPAALAPPLPHPSPPPLPDLAFAPDPLAAVPPPLPGAAPTSLGGDADLSLEESTSARAQIPGASDFAGFDPLESHLGAGGEVPGLELGGDLYGDLYQAAGAAATEPPTSPEITAEVNEEPAPPKPPPSAAPRASIAAARASTVDREPAPVPAGGEGRGRLRAVFLNSFSLVVLLLVTLGMLALSRGEGTLAQRILGSGKGPPAKVVAANVTSGLYETAHGRPLLFVRGAVRSQSVAPLGPVVVRAEIVVGNEVVARAEGLAGAVATPEELAGIAGPEDADRLRAALAPRAQREIRPGESVPFLVTFTDWPSDLAGATFRVVALAQRG